MNKNPSQIDNFMRLDGVKKNLFETVLTFYKDRGLSQVKKSSKFIELDIIESLFESMKE